MAQARANITMVRMAVARLELTFSKPTLARIDVSAAKIADKSAKKAHIVRSLVHLRPVVVKTSLLYTTIYATNFTFKIGYPVP
jgi:hypothetical protein